jgi:uncharacterized protein YgiM (DUF1202 family)
MRRKSNRAINGTKQILAWAALALIVILLAVNRPQSKTEHINAVRGSGTTKSATTSEGEKSSTRRAEIIIELLNLRSAPSMSKQSITGTLKKGEVVEVLEEQPGWLRIKVDDGRSGYIAYQSEYLRFME